MMHVSVEDNYQRHVRAPIGRVLEGVRFILEETWGGTETRLYQFLIEGEAVQS